MRDRQFLFQFNIALQETVIMRNSILLRIVAFTMLRNAMRNMGWKNPVQLGWVDIIGAVFTL